MNKKLLLALGFVCSTLCYGQQGVNPLDEFTYTSLKTTATSNESIPFLNNPNLPDPDLTNSMVGGSASDIGETSGELSVSLTGGANYTVPIAVPPGINSVVPSISLSYSSQGSNGLAGFGWNITGVSVITRIPSTKFHDNYIDPVNFNALDRFSFDGQRLVLKSGTYGANGAQYETENYSNVKIVSYGASPFGAHYGPSYFIVSYPDGSFAHYGNSPDSKSRTDYAINYWENPQGVRISYSYISADNSLSISKIKYGSRSTATPINELQFVYAPRKRFEQAYMGESPTVANSFIRKNLLKEIKILAGTVGYKNYILTHAFNSLGYDRLVSVQEKNGDNTLAHTPITFSYSTSPATITNDRNIITELGIGNIEQRNAETMSLDLNGDGKMDFLVYPKAAHLKTKFWVFKELQTGSFNYPIEVNSGAFEAVFPVSWLTHNNKLDASQGIAIVQNSTATNQIKFKVYSNGISAPIYYQYEKLWNAPTYTNRTSCNNNINTYLVPQEYISGDFNGDGLSDVIAIGKPYSYNYCYLILPEDCERGYLPERQQNISTDTIDNGPQVIKPPLDDCCVCYSGTMTSSQVNLISLDRRMTTNFVKSAGFLSSGLKSTDQIMAFDMNGDGKTDIVHISEGKISVYTLNNTDNLTLLWQTSDSRIKLEYQPMIGDFNGDGKMDFMYPTANNSSLFALFMSTGTSFNKSENTYPFTFKLSSLGSTTNTYNLVPVDVNGDGKTDILEYKTTTYNGNSNGSQTITLYNNTFTTSTEALPAFINTTAITKSGNLKHFPIPIFLSPDKPNSNLNFASISDNAITSFAFNQDNREDMLLRSVTNNGHTQTINYKSLDPSESGHNYNPIYTVGYNQVYPYADIGVVLGLKVVSQLQRISSGTTTLSQNFNYHGAVSNVEGLGFMGFEGVARSNWNTGNDDIIWNISKQDMSLRGAVSDNYAMLGYYTYTVPSSSYISKTTYNYTSTLLGNKVFKISSNSMLTQNALENTITTQSFLYDGYNNLTKSTTSYSGQGTTVLDLTYANSTTSPYYIGRPLTKIETNTINGNSFSSEEQYVYTNNLISTKKLKGNGTPYDIETYLYDDFGNITKKTTTPYNTGARTVNFEYDIFGRYLTKATDVEGLITLFDYNTTTGTLKKETNPYGLITNYVYDGWDRLIKVTDYLSKNANTTYVESGYFYTVTVTADNGASSINIYDPLKRLITEKNKDVLGQWINKSYQYDKFDRPWKVSEPYTGAASQWNTTEFDVYGRPTKLTSFTGKTTNISYSGLSTTVNDGTKTVVTTKNPTGQISQVTDPGGTINYTYYGNGALKTANYDGVILTTEQDGWGRKTKTTDPAAGTYTYTYNGFGEILTETTPKGTTTYTYSSLGKLNQKKIVGDLTNMTIDYAYDSTSKLINSMSLVNTDGNNSNYAYTYDGYKRLVSTTETNPYAQFIKTFTYDTYGQVATEKSEAKLLVNNMISIKTIKNNYQYGGLKSITDNSTLEVLWNVSGLNAHGQVTTSTMGTNLRKNFTYDPYGYLTQFKSEKNINATPVELVKLTFAFDTQKGLLNSRTNSLFAWNESFTYDNLDRLVSFNDNTGNKSHTYDTQGRITNNTSVGTYAYTGKSYQLKELTLNTSGQAFYAPTTRQDITYTAFKSPVDITEAGKDKISFQYNASMGRSNMFYGDTNSDKLLRPMRKHYSADGSMEITYEKNTGKTTFITYMAGDAYSAPAIWRSEQLTSISEQYLYLHRDYLGSIIGITDKDGNFKEKRHFDAWGNIVKLTDGNNVALTKFGVFDRGYTGHEHLLGVGLVHMNGRLYDPVVHRFLMPDNFVQDPYSTQFYNRYGYVLNNPLKYTDPSGEIIPFIVWAGAAIIGAYIGGAQANGTWNPLKWNYQSSSTWIGMAGGAAIGVASVGIGIAVTAAITPALTSLGITGGILGGGITGIVNGTIVGAISGGFSSVLPGGSGNFWGGMLSGAITGAWTGGLLGATLGGILTPKGHNIWTGVAPRPAVAPVSTLQSTGISTMDDAATIKAEVLASKTASPSPSTNTSAAPVPTTPIKDGMGVVEVNIKPVQNSLDLSAAKGGFQYSDDLLEAAQKAYPNLAGKTQMHHITPKYLGGPANGPLINLDAAYHQQITNAFRAEWAYGIGKPSAAQLDAIMRKVYSQFPLPK